MTVTFRNTREHEAAARALLDIAAADLPSNATAARVCIAVQALISPLRHDRESVGAILNGVAAALGSITGLAQRDPIPGGLMLEVLFESTRRAYASTIVADLTPRPASEDLH